MSKVTAIPVDPVFPRFSKHSFDPVMFSGEVNIDPSETVPDDTLTIQEIYDRYCRGERLDVQKVPIYSEDQDGFDDEFSEPGLDLADLSIAEQEMRDLEERAPQVPAQEETKSPKVEQSETKDE